MSNIKCRANFFRSVAAKRLNVSQTYLKKICRQLNILRWPYRKLASLQKKIDGYMVNITKEHLEPDTKYKILVLRLEMQSIIDNPSIINKQKDQDRASSPESPPISPDNNSQQCNLGRTSLSDVTINMVEESASKLSLPIGLNLNVRELQDLLKKQYQQNAV
jgi:hypothetical protein